MCRRCCARPTSMPTPSPPARCCTWRATSTTAPRPRRRSATPPQIAHANDRLVSLTLSDSFCVDRHRDDFRALVTDEVDLLFGNEDELMSLYEVESMDEARRGRARRLRAGGRSRSVPTGCMVVTADDVLHASRPAGRAGARHDRRRRPVRRRIPVRLHPSPIAGRLRPASARSPPPK